MPKLIGMDEAKVGLSKSLSLALSLLVAALVTGLLAIAG